MKKVIIDPGHGGSDPGAVANGYLEKELNLVVARRVQDLLKDSGIQADLTRDNDETLSSSIRTNRVENKYEYCLSIHFNRFNGDANGVETIHSINGKIGEDLAESLAAEINNKIGLKVRRVFSREGSNGNYYFMHRNTGKTITIIIEGMFIDNEKDIDSLNIEKLAEGIAEGFIEHLNTYNEKIEKPNYKHSKVATTNVIEVNPLDLKISVQDKPGYGIDVKNFMTSGYQWHHANGETYPLGILVSEGKIISDRQPHGLAAGTLIVYKDGSVDVKPLISIKEEKNVWFAVSGCSILPKILMHKEGFTGPYADIGRSTWRPVIGYNEKTKKVVLALRPSTNIERGQNTLKNLGCSKGITLDGGGSSILKVNNRSIHSTTRRLYSVITW